MSAEIEQYLEILAGTRKILLDAIASIPDEKFAWQPGPAASSAEAIVQHIGVWESRYLSVIVHGDDRVTDRTILTLKGKKNLVARTEQIRSSTLQIIRQLKPQELDTLRPYDNTQRTVRHMLLRLLRHEYYHTGQINYIYLLLNPSATGEAVPPPQ